jgi:hypothetical protein
MTSLVLMSSKSSPGPRRKLLTAGPTPSHSSTTACHTVRRPRVVAVVLVWLVGMDGNDHDPEDRLLVATHQRMLERRSAPLIVAEGDRMPADVPSVSPELLSEPGTGQPPE